MPNIDVIQVVLRALLTFFHLVQRCSQNTMRIFFQNIPLEKVIRTATSLLLVENSQVSSCMEDEKQSETSLMIYLYKQLCYRLLGAIAEITNDNKLQSIGNICYRSILTENMMCNLLKIASTSGREENDRKLSSKLYCHFLNIFSQSCILLIETPSYSTSISTLGSILFSVCDSGIIVGLHDKTRYMIQNTVVFLTCMCQFVQCEQIVLKENGWKNSVAYCRSNANGAPLSQKLRKSNSRTSCPEQTTNKVYGNVNHAPSFSNDMFQILLKPHFVIPLSWILVHSDKDIYSSTEVLIETIVNTIMKSEKCVFVYECLQVFHIWDLLRHGYIQCLRKFDRVN